MRGHMNRIIVMDGIRHQEIRNMITQFKREGDSIYLLLSGEEAEWLRQEKGTELWQSTDRQEAGTDFHMCIHRRDYAETVRALYEEILEEKGKVDILVYAPCARAGGDGAVGEGHSCEDIYTAVERNVMGFRTLVDSMMPLMSKSTVRRIAVITEENASVRNCTAERDYGYHMSLAAINMAEKIYFNRLRKEGFTFRNYAGSSDGGKMGATWYVTCGLSNNPEDPPMHSDENRLVMRNSLYEEIAW